MRLGLVIVAAGVGERLGQGRHKALVPVGGRPMLLRCAEIFSSIPAVEERVLVVHADDLDALEDGELGRELRRYGAWRVVPGGARRQDSVLAGLRALGEAIEGALVHDAARPFVSRATIEALGRALEDAVGAVPVVPVASTVKRIGDGGRVVETLPRASLRLAQTPQAGRRRELIAALEAAAELGLEVTDDVAALEHLGHQVIAIPDSPWNFKVTTPQDLVLAELVAREGLWLEEGGR
ncbi:MAG: 2-C-methyl-D-erythritol 4-phosphate cytidylyltransferase [Planctomycetes bacterium]|nr:2-C-methyl-D-erythritol 4-phosphate cytidylyltransferase [Planctomycetota bacterium]